MTLFLYFVLSMSLAAGRWALLWKSRHNTNWHCPMNITERLPCSCVVPHPAPQLGKVALLALRATHTAPQLGNLAPSPIFFLEIKSSGRVLHSSGAR